MCFSPYGVARENLTIQFFIPLFADAAWTVTLLIIHTCTQESQITNRIQSTTLKQINRSQIPPPPPPQTPEKEQKKKKERNQEHIPIFPAQGERGGHSDGAGAADQQSGVRIPREVGWGEGRSGGGDDREGEEDGGNGEAFRAAFSRHLALLPR